MSKAPRLLWPALACLVAFLLGFFYGLPVGRYRIFPYYPLRDVFDRVVSSDDGAYGRWFASRATPGSSGLDEDEGRGLEALGYLPGYSPPPPASGVIRHEAERAQPGLTLITSGHDPVAQLLSMEGEVVHEWRTSFEELWPGKLPFRTLPEHRQFLRRARVLPNGDLLAIFEYIGIVKLDKDSRVLWKRLNQAHHDLTVARDGTIVTLVRQHLPRDELVERLPGFAVPGFGVVDDQLAFLDPSGEELRRVSLLEAFARSDYALSLDTRSDQSDLFHANSVHLIEPGQERPGLREGEVLVSLRNQHAIVSVDIEGPQVTWRLAGQWGGQHQASLLPNGNLLLLDNLGGNRSRPFLRDRSQILELNPLTQEIVWRYGGSEAAPFFTHWLGFVERLPNGNTLITESVQGRLLEVTADGEIVWEYLSPHRAGAQRELIATIMGAQRLDPASLTFLRP